MNMEPGITDEWLDRQLREAAPYIEDDGFTARVLRQLPARQPRGQFLRTFILVGMSSLASALAYVLSDGGRFVIVEMFKLTTIPTIWVLAFALATGLLVMAGGIVAATSRTVQFES
ncbi:MAG: hypothetical protein ABR514_08275 [Chthoniobacterales bacterium]